MVVSFRFFLTLNPDDGSKPTPTMDTYVFTDSEGKSMSEIRITVLSMLFWILYVLAMCAAHYEPAQNAWCWRVLLVFWRLQSSTHCFTQPPHCRTGRWPKASRTSPAAESQCHVSRRRWMQDILLNKVKHKLIKQIHKHEHEYKIKSRDFSLGDIVQMLEKETSRNVK